MQFRSANVLSTLIDVHMYLLQVNEGLTLIHAQGLLHRDLAGAVSADNELTCTRVPAHTSTGTSV